MEGSLKHPSSWTLTSKAVPPFVTTPTTRRMKPIGIYTTGLLNSEPLGPVRPHHWQLYWNLPLHQKVLNSVSRGTLGRRSSRGTSPRWLREILVSHVYGSAIGSLTVYTEMNGVLGPSRWSQTGQTISSQWYQASISLVSGEDFKLVFISQTRVGSVGNIAIDDIDLMSGTC